jgi:carboxymethylenebutenolidase
MKFIVLGVLLAGYLTSAAGSPRAGSTVKYISGKDTVTGYLCVPQGNGPFPAVILIHEWWGLTDWVKENAKRFASNGYVALAIDLYRGKLATSNEMAHELMRGLPEDRAARDLAAAAAYLKGRPDVKPAKIGSIGWCMGGGYSLGATQNIPDLAGCVVCYGRLFTDSSAIAKIPCPVLGLFGELDQGIPAQSVRDFEADAKKAGKDVSVAIYPDAGHQFMNPSNKNKPGYRSADAKDAWAKIDEFFKRTLKP